MKFTITFWIEALWNIHIFQKIIHANSFSEAKKKAEEFLQQVGEKNVFYDIGLLEIKTE